jgi:hypothetical protein
VKRFIMKLLCSSILCFGFFSLYPSSEVVIAQEEPAYAKWGRLAMQKVKEKYPDAKIVDYLHVGREKGMETSTETFKLWLEGPNNEFGVFIDITFDNNTEEIVDIKFREVSS